MSTLLNRYFAGPFAVFFGILVGCGQASDPLVSFEAMANSCRVALAKPRTEKVYQGAGESKWNKLVYSANSVTYDVRKTDSPVSPHTGYIEIKYEDVVLQAGTEAEAKSASVNGAAKPVLSTKQRYLISFAHQQGKWVTQSVKAGIQITSIPDMDEAVVEISSHQLAKEFPEAVVCVPATR